MWFATAWTSASSCLPRARAMNFDAACWALDGQDVWSSEAREKALATAP